MRYLFNDCVLDTDCYTLQRQGRDIQLQPREFKMLAYLLEQRHRVVSRQELFEQVWSGQYVSKAALEGCSLGTARCHPPRPSVAAAEQMQGSP